MTLRVSACCILLRIARRIWSSCSPSWVPAREISVDTNRPTKAAVNSEVRGSSSWLTTCMTYQRPLFPCSSLHWATCSRATETYARRHSPPFWRGEGSGERAEVTERVRGNQHQSYVFEIFSIQIRNVWLGLMWRPQVKIKRGIFLENIRWLLQTRLEETRSRRCVYLHYRVVISA